MTDLTQQVIDMIYASKAQICKAKIAITVDKPADPANAFPEPLSTPERQAELAAIEAFRAENGVKRARPHKASAPVIHRKVKPKTAAVPMDLCPDVAAKTGNVRPTPPAHRNSGAAKWLAWNDRDRLKAEKKRKRNARKKAERQARENPDLISARRSALFGRKL